MNILYAILDLVRAVLVWAWGFVLDREPQGGEAFRLLFLLLFTGIATWLTFYWRDLLLRWRFIRARFLPGEHFAGQYVQAVKRGEEALQRGEYLTHEQVGQGLRRFLEP